MSKTIKTKKKKTRPPIFSERKKGDFITIKTTLKSILKDYNKNFPIIDKLVKDCNHIVINTYQLIRLFILNKYHNNKEIPKFDRNLILNFIKIGGITGNKGPKPKNQDFLKELQEFYNNEYQPLTNQDKYNLKDYSIILEYLSINIETGLYNNIKEHFITRFRRFINIICPYEELKNIKDKENKSIFNKIKNILLMNKLADKEFETIPKKYKEWVMMIRNKYLPTEINKNIHYDSKSNPHKYMYYTILMSDEIEKKEEENQKKLYQSIPLRTDIIPKYITIDCVIILQYLCKTKGESSSKLKITGNEEYIWSKILNTKSKVLNKKGYIYKTILTDGIGVSICFQKIDIKKSNNSNVNEKDDLYIDDLTDEELEICKSKKIIGIDPNKLSQVYMTDENKNKLRYTTPQKSAESYSKKYKNIINKEKNKNGIIKLETEFSKLCILHNFSSKTINYNKFKEYIKNKTILNTQVKDFYELIKFRKFRLRVWVYSRKSEDRFINRISETYNENGKNNNDNKDDLLLVYGNWGENRQMKHLHPSKTKGLRKLIKKKYEVVLMDEFRTSKLCSICHNELDNCRMKKGKLHRLLICKNCKDCDNCKDDKSSDLEESDRREVKKITYLNRDLNSSMNILNLGLDYIFKNRYRNPKFSRKKIDLV